MRCRSVSILYTLLGVSVNIETIVNILLFDLLYLSDL